MPPRKTQRMPMASRRPSSLTCSLPPGLVKCCSLPASLSSPPFPSHLSSHLTYSSTGTPPVTNKVTKSLSWSQTLPTSCNQLKPAIPLMTPPPWLSSPRDFSSHCSGFNEVWKRASTPFLHSLFRMTVSPLLYLFVSSLSFFTILFQPLSFFLSVQTPLW